MLAGAIVGGVVGHVHGVPGTVIGFLAGIVLGGFAGWAYGFLLMFEMSVVGVLWRAARKLEDRGPTELEMKRMTAVGVRGIAIGELSALVCWFNLSWGHALVAAVIVGVATAVIAVAWCERAEAV
jgi:hypothetical protein